MDIAHGQPRQLTLCCHTANCPQVTVDGDQVTITDDQGGVVRMDRGQYGMLLERGPELLDDEPRV